MTSTRTPSELYHFTCLDHGLAGIESAGELRPNEHPMIGFRLIWLTSDPDPVRDAVGLTSTFLTCDRTAARCTVTDTAHCLKWHGSNYRRLVHPANLAALEDPRWTRPDTWWISTRTLAVASVEVLERQERTS